MKGFQRIVDIYNSNAQLTGVDLFRDADLGSAPVAVRLAFGDVAVLIRVDEDTDSVFIEESATSRVSGLFRVDASSQEPWNSAMGCSVRWAWCLVDQQGYDDGLQLEFHSESPSRSVAVQIVGIASTVSIRLVSDYA